MVERYQPLQTSQTPRSPESRGSLDIRTKRELTHEELVAILGFDHRVLLPQFLQWMGIIDHQTTIPFSEVLRPHDDHSDALYAIDAMRVGNDLIYAYYLGPLQVTSNHYHERPGMTEEYYSLWGEMYLQNGGKFDRVPPGGTIINVGDRHHLEIPKGRGVLAVVKLNESADVPSHQRHSGRMRPINRFLKAA